MIFRKRKYHQNLSKFQNRDMTDVSSSDFSESFKPLTKDGSPDRIKKFSYIDVHGDRSESLKKQSKKKYIRDMDLEIVGKYINIGYYLVIPILIGTILGIYLDSKFGTQPKLTLTCILL